MIDSWSLNLLLRVFQGRDCCDASTALRCCTAYHSAASRAYSRSAFARQPKRSERLGISTTLLFRRSINIGIIFMLIVAASPPLLTMSASSVLN